MRYKKITIEIYVPEYSKIDSDYFMKNFSDLYLAEIRMRKGEVLLETVNAGGE